MKKKKIGLVLAYRGVNYGMLLQAFATQRFIEMQGFETEILEYTRTDYKHIRLTPWLAVYALDEAWKRIIKRPGERRNVPDDLHIKNMEDRRAVSGAFIEKRLKNRRVVRGIEALEAAGKEYGAVVVGSDQIWPPDAAFGNFTTLRFVPDKVNKISYATSLGVSSYPYYCRSSAAQFWKRIDHLSVREERGKEIIQEICGLNAEVVVDPVYLFTDGQWKELIPEERITDGRYLLCYFLGGAQEHKRLARAFADRKGLKLVSILSTESVSSIDVSYADEIAAGKGPEAFVNLVRHAEYVFTDSFHGTAFSVISGRQFYVFYRTRAGSPDSRNSRIDSVLKMWGLEDRLVPEGAVPEDLSGDPIDYGAVNRRIERERRKSVSFFLKALGECT